MRRAHIIPAALALVAAIFCGSVTAEPLKRLPVQSPVLIIDPERLFEESAFGRQTITEFEALGAALASENRRIEDALSQEERELTDLRPTISPTEFRTLADDFDAKVQETRRTQDAKGRDLNANLEKRRVVFLNSAVPVLEQLMREAGAAVVLEQRSVFISSNAIDITEIAIERLNEILKDTEALPEEN